MANEHYLSGDKQFKFVLVGGGAVGKTSLILRFIQDQFEKQYKQTAGADFFMKRVSLPGVSSITVHLWDVGGQSLNGQMVDKYIYGANALLFVYDITNASSFDLLNDWLNVAHQVFQEDCIMPHLAVVANKCDLEHMRVVKHEKHLKFAQDNGMSSHNVSAKTGESVNLCFQKIVGELLGIRLTRSEQENAQPVVKAEIVQTVPTGEKSVAAAAAASCNTVKTTVCILQ